MSIDRTDSLLPITIRSLMRSMLVVCFLVSLPKLAVSSATADFTITSNDFSILASTISQAPVGSVIDFDLGSNSTITFSNRIDILKSVTLRGGNRVTFDGANGTGLFFVRDGDATFEGLTFQNASQSGGGAIVNFGNLSVDRSVFRHNFASNSGGAIDSPLGPLHVTNSVFYENRAGNVGGAVTANGASGSLTLENSTFFNNSAGNVGGAISSSVNNDTYRHITVVGNSDPRGIFSGASGVDIDTRGSATIENSLIAANDGGRDLSGSTIIVRNSLIGRPEGNNLLDNVDGNIVGNGSFVHGFPIEMLVGPLLDNGGPTQTAALIESVAGITNPAIDSGFSTPELPFDQRGEGFARLSGAAPDLGAFEIQIPEPSSAVLILLATITFCSCRD